MSDTHRVPDGGQPSTGEASQATAMRRYPSQRHARGEDVRPLVSAVLGGVVGGALALAVDRLVPSPAPSDLAVPSLLSTLLPMSAAGAWTGVFVVLVLSALAATVFAYGQFRRFVPGPPWLAGAVWGVIVAVVAVSALAPLVAPVVVAETPELAILGGASVVLEILAGGLVYGCVVGVLNPRRET